MSESRHHHTPGEVIARHRHDGEHQLLYVSSGVFAVTTEHGTWVAGAQRAIWTPAETWHEHRVHGHAQVHLLRFPPEERLFPGERPTVIAVTPLLRELLMACTEPGLPAAEARRLRAVVRDRVRRADLAALTLPTARDPRLVAACRLVTGDLATPRTITWLARRAGTSDRQLSRLFRAEFGCTYPQWRTAVRVFHAMLELSAGTSVTGTAHRCGWATASAFVDAFARTTGQTPGAYQAGERTSVRQG